MAVVELAGGDEELAKDVAMHVAAVNPAVVSPADMPEELVQKEREIYAAQAADSGKPPEIVEKMIEGRVRKYLSENSLTEQAFVKDPDTTVGKLVQAAGATIAGFTRFGGLRGGFLFGKSCGLTYRITLTLFVYAPQQPFVPTQLTVSVLCFESVRVDGLRHGWF